MIYNKYSPDPLLKPFVECYYIWESEVSSNNELVVESPPNGFCSIVFNYGDTYFLQNKKYERLQVPSQFVAGQSLYSYKLFLSGTIGIAGIVLKPAALATLFNLNTYEFTEERTDLLAVFSKNFIGKYIQRVKEADNSEERIKAMEAFLLFQYHTKKPETDFIDEAANSIIEKKGLLNVTDLLKSSNMSRRTFERKFFQKVGLSPKYYARIRRIGYLCNLIAGKQKVNWADVFYECEFYDQAHFIKDFEEFTGRTPQQYLKENTELANLVQKPTTQSRKD